VSLSWLWAVPRIALDAETAEGWKDSFWSNDAKEVRGLCIVGVQEAQSDECLRGLANEDKSVLDITLPYDQITSM